MFFSRRCRHCCSQTGVRIRLNYFWTMKIDVFIIKSDIIPISIIGVLFNILLNTISIFKITVFQLMMCENNDLHINDTIQMITNNIAKLPPPYHDIRVLSMTSLCLYR